MNPDQFKKHLNAVQIQIKTFAKKDAPRIAGKVRPLQGEIQY